MLMYSNINNIIYIKYRMSVNEVEQRDVMCLYGFEAYAH